MPDKSANYKIPPGLKLRHTLRGHRKPINRIAWSPDGRTLASPSNDRTIRLWDAETGDLHEALEGHSGSVLSVAWSPNGRMLASGSEDETIRLWDVETWELRQTLRGHANWVWSVAWSPDGRTLASGSTDKTIQLWDVQTGELCKTLRDRYPSHVYSSVVWSPDGWTLASASRESIVRLWDPETGRQVGALEGHTRSIKSLSFSPDGRLFASSSWDSTVRLWRCDTWETVAVLGDSPTSGLSGLGFHPQAPALATLGKRGRVIRIWDLDLDILLSAVPILQGKIETGDFDVFLCHNSEDKPAVKEIGERLKEQGILPWLDEWELRPGLPWQRLLEEQIEQIKTAAVFIGQSGIGPWQQLELEAFLREFVSRGCPVIPVLLADAPKKPKLPVFLRGMTWVDFRKDDPDPMEQLIWGITGERARG